VTTADSIATRISDGELARRWRAVRAAMAEQGIDALLMQSSNDWLGGTIKWFTDIPANNGYPRTVIFPAAAPMTIIEMGPFNGRRSLEADEPVHRGVGELRFAPAFSSVGYTAEYDARLVAETLRQDGYRTIGLVGGGYLPHALITTISSGAGERVRLVDATDLVDAIKAIKSEEEVALIRRTAALQDAVFAGVLKTLKPGMRDLDVAAAAWHTAQTLGSEQGIVLGTSAPLGERSGFAGRHFQGRTLAKGDHLSLLIEVNGPGGFYTELARTIVLGRASSELLEGFAAVHEAQNATLRHMRPGVACGAIAAAHDSFMQSLGLPVERRLFSHGQGYDMVERPLIRRDETMTLRTGSCLAVHPGYETPSFFAVICDNYMIDATGPGPCLHRTEKKIFEV
jgi:Xaa-Pro aminopeptidase